MPTPYRFLRWLAVCAVLFAAQSSYAQVQPVPEVKWPSFPGMTDFKYDSFREAFGAEESTLENHYETTYSGDWYLKTEPWVNPPAFFCENCGSYTHYFESSVPSEVFGFAAFERQNGPQATYDYTAFSTFYSPVFVCPQGYNFTVSGGVFQCICAGGGSCTTANNEKMAGKPKVCVGNPCDPFSGNKFQKENDYRSPASGGVGFTRYYNSRGFEWNLTLGPRWTHNYNRRIKLSFFKRPTTTNDKILFTLVDGEWVPPRSQLVYELVSSSARLERPDGQVLHFQGSGTVNIFDDYDNIYHTIWFSDPDVTGKLESLFDTGDLVGFRYTHENDEVEIYNKQGLLQSITTRSGVVQTLSYDANNRLISVIDSFGRTLTFDYDASGRIETVTDPAGGEYLYAYDAQGRLSTVTAPGNQVRTYLYENTTHTKALTGIIDESSTRFATWDYDSLGRVTLSEHAGGAEQVTLTYNASNTVVTDPLNTARTFSFDTKYGVHRNTAINTPCDDCPGVKGKTTVYDANGFPSGVTDHNNIQTQYIYNSRGLETERTEADGTSLERTITTAWHSSYRLPTMITEPGRTLAFSYDSSGNMLTRTETDTTVTPNVSRTTTWTYNSIGQVLTVDGPRTDVNDVTTYAYNSAGNLTSITNALNQQTQFTAYNAHGNPLTIIDPNNVTTTLTYDARQRLLTRTAASGTPDAATTTFEYWPTGKLKKIIQPDASYLLYTYDGAQRLIRVEDNLGNYISYTLDDAGNRTEEKIYDPAAVLVKTQTSIFSNLSRLIETLGGASQSTEYGYDGNGNPTSVIDPNNNTTTHTFDALNRLIKTVDPQNGATNPTEYTYDARDNLISVEDPRGLVTQYQYNGFNEVIQQTSPDTGVTTYAYDAAGNRTAQTDARGVTTVYHYDALNRLTQIEYSDPDENVYFDYDTGDYGIGRLHQITDATGATEYEYDARGNIVEAVYHRVINGQPQSYTMGYQYDAADRLTQLTYASGRTVDYIRDSAGRVVSVSTGWHGNNTTLAQSIEYLPFGPVSQLTYGNGLVDTRAYDQDYRLTDISVGATSLEYGYDPNGNIDYIETLPTVTDSQLFDYDSLNRLTEATGPYGLRDYVYDPVGNRLSETDDTPQTETYTYDLDSNQLAQRGTLQYQYDAAGNTTTDGQYTFSYTLAGRLGAVQAGATPVAYYLYNGLGQRVVKTVGSNARVYLYDLNGLLISEIDLARNTHIEYIYLDGRPLAQITPRPDLWDTELEHVLTDVQDPNQTATVSLNTDTQTLEFTLSGGGGQTYLNPPVWDETHFDNQRYLAIEDPQTGASTGYAVEYSLYLYEDNVQAVLHLTPKAGGADRVFMLETSTTEMPPIAYYHTDHLGTPKALTDSAQNLVWWVEYEPFGKANITTELIGNNLRFPGQYFDQETGLHYNYFRDYDPVTGRYIESDPIGLKGGLNTYSYVMNNPINHIDPNGQFTIVEIGVGVTAIGTAICLFIPDCRARLEQGTRALINEISEACESSEEERCNDIITDCFLENDDRSGHNDPYTEDFDNRIRQCVADKAPECVKYLPKKG